MLTHATALLFLNRDCPHLCAIELLQKALREIRRGDEAPWCGCTPRKNGRPDHRVGRLIGAKPAHLAEARGGRVWLSLDHIPPLEAEMLCGSEKVLVVGMDFAKAVFHCAGEVESVRGPK